jgi:hypothetical protein
VLGAEVIRRRQGVSRAAPACPLALGTSRSYTAAPLRPQCNGSRGDPKRLLPISNPVLPNLGTGLAAEVQQPSSLAHPHRLDALLSQRSSAHCSSPRSTATSGASLVIRGMLAGLEMAAQACLCGAAWAAGRTLHHHSPSVCPAALCLSLSARMLPQALHCEVLENCQELLCP